MQTSLHVHTYMCICAKAEKNSLFRFVSVGKDSIPPTEKDSLAIIPFYGELHQYIQIYIYTVVHIISIARFYCTEFY